MKFMSNAAVFIVIAAFAACAAGAVNIPAERSLDEQPGDSLRLRLRACFCNIHGCSCTRFKREDLATLDAALGVYEDEISKQIGNHRARRSSDGDSAVEAARATEALRLSLRACFCNIHGCSCTRFKREDLATLDAALGVYEDAALVGDNGESAGDEQTGDSLRLRLRGCFCNQHGCSCTRLKREDLASLDAALSVYEDAAPVGDNGESAGVEQTGASLRLRRGCYCGTNGCECSPQSPPIADSQHPQRQCTETVKCDSNGCKITKTCN
jgi:hypothetical protein